MRTQLTSKALRELGQQVFLANGWGKIRKMPTPPKNAATGPKSRVLGRQAFAAITAVEGLELSAASRRRLDSLTKSGLSADERRAEILRTYKGLGGRR